MKNKNKKTLTRGRQKPMEFKAYVLWKSLPPMLIGQSEDELKKLGISDEFTISLLSLKTQQDFAKKFKLSESTLTEWNGSIPWDQMQEMIKGWARGMHPSIVAAFARATIKEGDAARFKEWRNFIEDRAPSGEGTTINIAKVEVNNKVLAVINEAEEKLREVLVEQIKEE